MDNKKKTILGIVLASVIVILIGASYAYFGGQFTASGSNVDIKLARLGLIYKGDSAVSLQGAYPGDSTTKTFTIENTSDEKLSYQIYWKDLVNSFLDDELVFSLNSDNGGGEVTETSIPLSDTNMTGIINIPAKTIQTYTMTITFKEMDRDQNNNMGAVFSGLIQIRGIDSTGMLAVGGQYNDEFKQVIPTSDGGYIAVGNTNSPIVNGVATKGKTDALIVKIDKYGAIEWTKTYGGSEAEYYYSVIEDNNTYIAVGSSISKDKDLTETSYSATGLYGDAIIVKYDRNGNILNKKTYGGSDSNGTGEAFYKIIKSGSSYVVVGQYSSTDGPFNSVFSYVCYNESIIIKFKNDLTPDWYKGYGNSDGADHFISLKETSDGGFIVVGGTSNLSIGDSLPLLPEKPHGYAKSAIILKYSPLGELQYRKAYYGTGGEIFEDVIEVSDGYVAVGYSSSNDILLSGMNKGDYDGIIVKFDKTLSNIIWKKNFGGAKDDYFYGIESKDNGSVIAIGYSYSNDSDMNNVSITKNIETKIRTAVLVEYDNNGNLVNKKSYGGYSSDVLSSITKSSDGYILSGYSYSKENENSLSNNGAKDGLLLKIKNDFSVDNNLQNNPELLIPKKTFVKDYGSSIAISSNKITALYTTDDPTLNIFSLYTLHINKDPNSNCDYTQFIQPFNPDKVYLRDTILLKNGRNTYTRTSTSFNSTNWIKIYVNCELCSSAELTNLYVNFKDGYSNTIKNAVLAGYIEPLVLSGYSLMSSYYWPNSYSLIEGGSTGVQTAVRSYILLKPKKSILNGFTVTSSRDLSVENGALLIYEIDDWDISLSPGY